MMRQTSANAIALLLLITLGLLAAFARVDALPLTAHGELNRRALPPPDLAAHARASASVLQDEVVRKLVDIRARVLKVPHVSVIDDFFEMGGHSLLAIRLFAEMETEFGKSLPLGLSRYQPRPYSDAVTLFRTRRQPPWCSQDPLLGWGNRAAHVEMHPIAGTHQNILEEPHVASLASSLDAALARVQSPEPA